MHAKNPITDKQLAIADELAQKRIRNIYWRSVVSI